MCLLLSETTCLNNIIRKGKALKEMNGMVIGSIIPTDLKELNVVNVKGLDMYTWNIPTF